MKYSKPSLKLPICNILTVNYGMTLKHMIYVGKYASVNVDSIVKTFPIKGEGIQKFEYDLFDPKGKISCDMAFKLMIKDSDPTNPWTPASIEHLLALGATFHDLQRENLIVALGSVAEESDDRHVPCLYVYDSNRGLHRLYYEHNWDFYTRFLRIRKVNEPTTTGPSA